eukprot:SAG31_NODE_2874_length_4971_cov_9.677750_4_plen_105_part_00
MGDGGRGKGEGGSVESMVAVATVRSMLAAFALTGGDARPIHESFKITTSHPSPILGAPRCLRFAALQSDSLFDSLSVGCLTTWLPLLVRSGLRRALLHNCRVYF